MRTSTLLQPLGAFVLMAATTSALAAQECPDATRLTAGFSGPIATVRYLADDALGGRLAGSAGERCAGDFVAKRFAELKLQPAGDNGTYFQEFKIASATNPHAPAGTARNVMALLEGSDPQLKNELVIVGAHYDHLGEGGFGSTSKEPGPAIHNGADDNASGVAAMLEVAARMANGPRPARSVLFMAFSAEEQGLLGSSYFVNNPTVSLERARAMINLDMVGRLSQGAMIVYGIGTAKEWEKLVNDAAARENVAVTLNPDGYGASDHTSFYLKDIPVLHLFTNVHGDYHNPGDDWDKIDADGLVKVSSIVQTIASQIADAGAMITLVKGAGRAPTQSGSRGNAAYLGTIPDYNPVDYGVKISGVSDGSPAHAAGLKGGDVIIRFDADEVKDLQGMTDALRKRKPGDAVKITVLREGKEVVLNATLGKR